MALSDLTKASVHTAIKEFDDLGRDEFLRKYQFGKATTYFLEYEGRSYDSKAIAGAAHKYISEKDSPLRPQDFSGGEATVKRVFEALGFEVISKTSNNPPWSQDELILALEFYIEHRAKIPSKTSSEIAALSDEISAIAQLLNLKGGQTMRNINGVYMKLMNFRRLDPEFTDKGRVGLSRGSSRDEEVWLRYAHDKEELKQAALSVRSSLALSNTKDRFVDFSNVDIDPDFVEASEGALVTRIHRYRERDSKIVKKKKQTVLRTRGKLECECCGFNFQEKYGHRGAGYIECHHISGLAEAAEKRKTRLDDLALVCANCHRMIHARKEWLSLDALRSLLRA